MKRLERAFIWCGPVGLAICLIGILLARSLPPISPSESATQIATYYRTHTDLVRFGLLLMMYGGALLTPFVGVIASRLRHGSGMHRIAADAQVIFGAALVIEFVFPPMMLEAAAFRPARDPNIILALHDLGWLFYVGMVATFVVEMGLLGLVICLDDSPEPIFPRWAGYTNLGCALVSSLGGFCVFFQTGPFAWNGVLSFWVALASYGVWTVMMVVILLRGVGREETAAASPEAVLA